MSPLELNDILSKHRKWSNGEDGGERVDLNGANLTDANLRGANLTCANLNDADLTDADLTVADLNDADLTGANLYRANLRDANLTDANLRGVNLTGANLTGADLDRANLTGADLDVKNPPINDHSFVSEILFRESTNYKQRSWAGSIKISTDWCWGDFLDNCPKPMITWAKKILVGKWPEFEEKFK